MTFFGYFQTLCDRRDHVKIHTRNTSHRLIHKLTAIGRQRLSHPKASKDINGVFFIERKYSDHISYKAIEGQTKSLDATSQKVTLRLQMKSTYHSRVVVEKLSAQMRYTRHFSPLTEQKLRFKESTYLSTMCT